MKEKKTFVQRLFDRMHELERIAKGIRFSGYTDYDPDSEYWTIMDEIQEIREELEKRGYKLKEDE